MITFKNKSAPEQSGRRYRAEIKSPTIPAQDSLLVTQSSNFFIQLKSTCPCDGGCPRCVPVQAKLKIGMSNDKYEQEADRVANQVMCMPGPNVQRKAGCSSCGDIDEEEQIQIKSIGDKITPIIQGQEETGVEEEETAQLKVLPNKTPSVSTVLQSRMHSMRGCGQPLSASTCAFFEQRFGRDLSNVRVHSDSLGAGLAGSLNAKAFTIGNDVVFGAGQYSPGTRAGARLLAHELTHVLQQQSGTVSATIQKQPTPDEPPASVIHERIDVRAQFALQRLFRSKSAENRNDAIELFYKVDSGEIKGIYGDDLGIAAKLAAERGTVRWELVPPGQDAVWLEDELPSTPVIIFKEAAGRRPRLDNALLTVYRENRGITPALCVFPLGVLNGPHHEPLNTDTHAGMLIDITVLPSTGKPADIQGVLVREQVSESFDHTGSLADVPPIASRTNDEFQPAANFPPDRHEIQKAFVIDRAINHGGNGSLSLHQLDVFMHPLCWVTVPTVIPESGHRIDMIITRGAFGRVELTVRKSAEACTINGFTSQAGPSLTHYNTILVKAEGAGQEISDEEPQCPQAPTGLGFVEPEPACSTNPTKDIGLIGRHFHFCLDSDVLLVETPADIVEFAKAQAFDALFTVHGYASIEGGQVYNMRLACHRANRVARVLIEAGVAPERIEIASKGPTDEFPGGPDFNRVVVVHSEVPEAAQTTRCKNPEQAAELQYLFQFAKMQMAESMRRLRTHIYGPEPSPVVEYQIRKHFADIDVEALLTKFQEVADELRRGHMLICDNERAPEACKEVREAANMRWQNHVRSSGNDSGRTDCLLPGVLVTDRPKRTSYPLGPQPEV